MDASDGSPSVRDGSIGATGAEDGGADSGRAADGALLCRPGFADCDHDASNGCETSLADDPAHCGTCDVVCATTGVTTRSCEQGTCKVTCDPKHADCDGEPSNGCEIDVTASADNCGACKRACSSANVTTRACDASVCTPARCADHHGNCGAPAAPAVDDGCETDLTTSTNCGGCGHSCEAGSCGVIVPGECGPYDVLSNTHDADQIVADESFVHFTQSGSMSDKQLARISADFVLGAPVTPTAIVDNATIENLITDGRYVYWSDTANQAGAIERLRSGTSTQQVVRTGIPILGKLAVDSLDVYWLDYSNDVVYESAPSPSATAVTWIDFANGVGEMRSDGKNLFVSSATALLASNVTTKVLTSQTSLPALGLAPVGAALAFDATHVYAWFEETKAGADAPYHLVRFDKPALTNPVSLVATREAGGAMVVAANHVYYMLAHSLERVATDGTGQVLVDSNPVALTATSSAVYWIKSTSSGTVIRKMRVY